MELGRWLKVAFSVGCFGVVVVTSTEVTCFAADLSPENWDEEERRYLENRENKNNPAEFSTVSSGNGLITATLSPVSIRAGIESMKQGGNAADAAITVSLTQIARGLGSYVSYAGIAQILYYEKKSGKVFSIDAGWRTYRNETEPESIPSKKQTKEQQGRKTLVPGFMAGMDKFHSEFGRLPFADLLAPAIWYAENGVEVDGSLNAYFKMRRAIFERTPEGREFLFQSNGEPPVVGKLFYQPELAKTLHGIAEAGAKYMYKGPWAQEYADIIQREGGVATLEDLAGYEPIFQESLRRDFLGNTIHVAGEHSEGGKALLLAANLIELSGLHEKPPYWESPESFSEVVRLTSLFDLPQVWLADRARSKGVELDFSEIESSEYARQLLEAFPSPKAKKEAISEHTCSVVAVDPEGNVAVVIHSINTVVWGTTGIVVGGIPLADVGSPAKYKNREAGALVPNGLSPLIAFRGSKLSLAIGTIGAPHRRETVRILLTALGQKLNAEEIVVAPPWLGMSGKSPSIPIPEDGYSPEFIAELDELGVKTRLIKRKRNGSIQFSGVPSFIVTDEEGFYVSTESPAIMSFAEGF